MHKSLLAALALAFAAPAAQVLAPRPSFSIHSARIVVEYHHTHGEAALVVEAETDEVLEHLELLAPNGAKLLELSAGPGQSVPLHGLRVESVGPNLLQLFANCPEGVYTFRGRTPNGRLGEGAAQLSHRLVRPPAALYPVQGLAGVPTSNMTVAWQMQPSAVGYEVLLEQNDTDGLRVRLPPGASSFQVPDGWLLPATATVLELVAIGSDGNRTATEIEFTTQ